MTASRTVWRPLLVVAAVMAMLASLAPPADSATVATRAYVMAQVGDAYQVFLDRTEEDVNAELEQWDTDCFDDISGDLDGDGDNDSRDTRIREYICFSYDPDGDVYGPNDDGNPATGEAGTDGGEFGVPTLGAVIRGTDDGDYEPRQDYLRAQAVAIYNRAIELASFFEASDDSDPSIYVDLAREAPRDTLFADVQLPGAAATTHGCNIHRAADMDGDGAYVNDALPSGGTDEPFIVHGYLPRDGESFPDLFGPFDSLTEAQADLILLRGTEVVTDYLDDVDPPLCGGDTPNRPLPNDDHDDDNGDPTTLERAEEVAPEGLLVK